MTTVTLTKVCRDCKIEKPVSEFYKPKLGNYYLSYCKACSKQRVNNKNRNNEDYQVPYVESEKMAIEYLESCGIPTLPGKALRKSHVDAIAFGCVGIEVKYSLLSNDRGVEKYMFKTTPLQQQRGFLGSIVCLICDSGTERTFHFFDAKNPVFYMDDRLKTGFTFTPGAYEPLKFGETRVVMVQGMMDEAKDAVYLIYRALDAYCNTLSGYTTPPRKSVILEA